MVTLGCQTNVWKREMAAGKLFGDVLGEVKEAGCTGIESGWWQIAAWQNSPAWPQIWLRW